MTGFQPSLWDNMDLEMAYTRLYHLDFSGAETFLEQAKSNGLENQEVVDQVLSTCKHWKTEISKIDSDPDIDTLENLFNSFQDYNFGRSLRRFRKALLLFFVEHFSMHSATKIFYFEKILDSLIEIGLFENAEKLMEIAIAKYPKTPLLFYGQAQSQWLSGNKNEATSNYLYVLLHYPQHVYPERIENLEIKEFLNHYLPAEIPAFAWVGLRCPFVSTEGIIPINKEHQEIIEAYRLLQQAENAVVNKDKKYMFFRKELLNRAPELFAEYFKLLQKRVG